MQIVKITTTQNVDIDYEVAGLGDRVLARIVDTGVFMGVFYLVYIIIIMLYASSIYENHFSGGVPVALIVIGIIYTLVFVFYDLFTEIFFNGQSIGKYALKIRVVNINGARPTISQYLLRWVFRMVDFGITFGIGAIISVAVSDKKQRIGDIVAGTTLIKTIPRTELKDLYFAQPEDGYEPVFASVATLNDTDITLVHEVIANFKSSGNSQLVYEMAMRIKNHLGIDIPLGMNHFEFLKTVVKDYNYLISQLPV